MFKIAAKRVREFAHQQVREDLTNINHVTLELLWAARLNSLSDSVAWFQNRSIAPSGAAANYSFLYVLFYILEYVRPKNILEFGMGQSSMLTGQYVANILGDQKLFLVEQDAFWLNEIKSRLPGSTKIDFCLLKEVNISYKGHESYFYEGVVNFFSGKKFGLLILDGPYHSGPDFYRVGFANLLPALLEKEFIILIDDCQMKNIQRSLQVFLEVLRNENIEFDFHYVQGIKRQCFIYSPNYSFLKTI